MASALLVLLILLPSSYCCVFCLYPKRNLLERYKALCTKYKQAFNTEHCSKYQTANVFNTLGIGGDDMEAATEKTHRVFRVIEMYNTLEEFRTYWEWLLGVRLVEYSKNVLCPPKCKVQDTGFNCTTCKKQSMKCWSMGKCYPDEMVLVQVIIIIACSSAFCILAGFVVCYFELRRTKLSVVIISKSPPIQSRTSKSPYK